MSKINNFVDINDDQPEVDELLAKERISLQNAGFTDAEINLHLPNYGSRYIETSVTDKIIDSDTKEAIKDMTSGLPFDKVKDKHKVYQKKQDDALRKKVETDKKHTNDRVNLLKDNKNPSMKEIYGAMGLEEQYEKDIERAEIKKIKDRKSEVKIIDSSYIKNHVVENSDLTETEKYNTYKFLGFISNIMNNSINQQTDKGRRDGYFGLTDEMFEDRKRQYIEAQRQNNAGYVPDSWLLESKPGMLTKAEQAALEAFYFLYHDDISLDTKQKILAGDPLEIKKYIEKYLGDDNYLSYEGKDIDKILQRWESEDYETVMGDAAVFPAMNIKENIKFITGQDVEEPDWHFFGGHGHNSMLQLGFDSSLIGKALQIFGVKSKEDSSIKAIINDLKKSGNPLDLFFDRFEDVEEQEKAYYDTIQGMQMSTQKAILTQFFSLLFDARVFKTFGKLPYLRPDLAIKNLGNKIKATDVSRDTFFKNQASGATMFGGYGWLMTAFDKTLTDGKENNLANFYDHLFSQEALIDGGKGAALGALVHRFRFKYLRDSNYYNTGSKYTGKFNNSAGNTTTSLGSPMYNPQYYEPFFRFRPSTNPYHNHFSNLIYDTTTFGVLSPMIHEFRLPTGVDFGHSFGLGLMFRLNALGVEQTNRFRNMYGNEYAYNYSNYSRPKTWAQKQKEYPDIVDVERVYNNAHTKSYDSWTTNKEFTIPVDAGLVPPIYRHLDSTFAEAIERVGIKVIEPPKFKLNEQALTIMGVQSNTIDDIRIINGVPFADIKRNSFVVLEGLDKANISLNKIVIPTLLSDLNKKTNLTYKYVVNPDGSLSLGLGTEKDRFQNLINDREITSRNLTVKDFLSFNKIDRNNISESMNINADMGNMFVSGGGNKKDLGTFKLPKIFFTKDGVLNTEVFEAFMEGPKKYIDNIFIPESTSYNLFNFDAFKTIPYQVKSYDVIFNELANIEIMPNDEFSLENLQIDLTYQTPTFFEPNLSKPIAIIRDQANPNLRTYVFRFMGQYYGFDAASFDVLQHPALLNTLSSNVFHAKTDRYSKLYPVFVYSKKIIDGGKAVEDTPNTEHGMFVFVDVSQKKSKESLIVSALKPIDISRHAEKLERAYQKLQEFYEQKQEVGPLEDSFLQTNSLANPVEFTGRNATELEQKLFTNTGLNIQNLLVLMEAMNIKIDFVDEVTMMKKYKQSDVYGFFAHSLRVQIHKDLPDEPRIVVLVEGKGSELRDITNPEHRAAFIQTIAHEFMHFIDFLETNFNGENLQRFYKQGNYNELIKNLRMLGVEIDDAATPAAIFEAIGGSSAGMPGNFNWDKLEELMEGGADSKLPGRGYAILEEFIGPGNVLARILRFREFGRTAFDTFDNKELTLENLRNEVLPKLQEKTKKILEKNEEENINFLREHLYDIYEDINNRGPADLNIYNFTDNPIDVRPLDFAAPTNLDYRLGNPLLNYVPLETIELIKFMDNNKITENSPIQLHFYIEALKLMPPEFFNHVNEIGPKSRLIEEQYGLLFAQAYEQQFAINDIALLSTIHREMRYISSRFRPTTWNELIMGAATQRGPLMDDPAQTGDSRTSIGIYNGARIFMPDLFKHTAQQMVDLAKGDLDLIYEQIRTGELTSEKHLEIYKKADMTNEEYWGAQSRFVQQLIKHYFSYYNNSAELFADYGMAFLLYPDLVSLRAPRTTKILLDNMQKFPQVFKNYLEIKGLFSQNANSDQKYLSDEAERLKQTGNATVAVQEQREINRDKTKQPLLRNLSSKYTLYDMHPLITSMLDVYEGQSDKKNMVGFWEGWKAEGMDVKLRPELTPELDIKHQLSLIQNNADVIQKWTTSMVPAFDKVKVAMHEYGGIVAEDPYGLFHEILIAMVVVNGNQRGDAINPNFLYAEGENIPPKIKNILQNDVKANEILQYNELNRPLMVEAVNDFCKAYSIGVLDGIKWSGLADLEMLIRIKNDPYAAFAYEQKILQALQQQDSGSLFSKSDTGLVYKTKKGDHGAIINTLIPTLIRGANLIRAGNINNYLNMLFRQIPFDSRGWEKMLRDNNLLTETDVLRPFAHHLWHEKLGWAVENKGKLESFYPGFFGSSVFAKYKMKTDEYGITRYEKNKFFEERLVEQAVEIRTKKWVEKYVALNKDMAALKYALNVAYTNMAEDYEIETIKENIESKQEERLKHLRSKEYAPPKQGLVRITFPQFGQMLETVEFTEFTFPDTEFYKKLNKEERDKLFAELDAQITQNTKLETAVLDVNEYFVKAFLDKTTPGDLMKSVIVGNEIVKGLWVGWNFIFGTRNFIRDPQDMAVEVGGPIINVNMRNIFLKWKNYTKKLLGKELEDIPLEQQTAIWLKYTFDSFADTHRAIYNPTTIKNLHAKEFQSIVYAQVPIYRMGETLKTDLEDSTLLIQETLERFGKANIDLANKDRHKLDKMSKEDYALVINREAFLADILLPKLLKTRQHLFAYVKQLELAHRIGGYRYMKDSVAEAKQNSEKINSLLERAKELRSQLDRQAELDGGVYIPNDISAELDITMQTVDHLEQRQFHMFPPDLDQKIIELEIYERITPNYAGTRGKFSSHIDVTWQFFAASIAAYRKRFHNFRRNPGGNTKRTLKHWATFRLWSILGKLGLLGAGFQAMIAGQNESDQVLNQCMPMGTFEDKTGATRIWSICLPLSHGKIAENYVLDNLFTLAIETFMGQEMINKLHPDDDLVQIETIKQMQTKNFEYMLTKFGQEGIGIVFNTAIDIFEYVVKGNYAGDRGNYSFVDADQLLVTQNASIYERLTNFNQMLGPFLKSLSNEIGLGSFLGTRYRDEKSQHLYDPRKAMREVIGGDLIASFIKISDPVSHKELEAYESQKDLTYAEANIAAREIIEEAVSTNNYVFTPGEQSLIDGYFERKGDSSFNFLSGQYGFPVMSKWSVKHQQMSNDMKRRFYQDVQKFNPNLNKMTPHMNDNYNLNNIKQNGKKFVPPPKEKGEYIDDF